MNRRRLISKLVALAMAVALVEACSFCLLWLSEGALPTFGRFTEKRLEIAATNGDARALLASPDPLAMPQHLRGEVLHPFVGYVIDPMSPEAVRMQTQWRWALSEHGFPTDRDRPATVPENAVSVAVVGGSVATILAVNGQLLVDELNRLDVFDGRPIVIEGLAMPGHKQPQQLMTLTWMLSQGFTPEVVVNLDGFNDLALPVVENLPLDVHPAYPRAWPVRVAGLTSPEAVAYAGEAALAERRRSSLANRWNRLPLGGGMTANLVWLLLDRRFEGQRRLALAGIANAEQPERSMASNGPPWSAAAGDVLADVVALWRQSSLQLHRLCRANDISYLHFLQPSQYLPGAKVLSREERRKAFDQASPYREVVERGYPMLREAGVELRSSGVHFTDLTQLYADVTDSAYRDTCCHLNQLGHSMLVEAIAEEVAAAVTVVGIP